MTDRNRHLAIAKQFDISKDDLGKSSESSSMYDSESESDADFLAQNLDQDIDASSQYQDEQDSAMPIKGILDNDETRHPDKLPSM